MDLKSLSGHLHLYLSKSSLGQQEVLYFKVAFAHAMNLKKLTIKKSNCNVSNNFSAIRITLLK
jgi:hypothetical protein